MCPLLVLEIVVPQLTQLYFERVDRRGFNHVLREWFPLDDSMGKSSGSNGCGRNRSFPLTGFRAY